jgi:UDP-3-O-[3-hydroxymyristoyl] glucosamine N-acyltransferase
MLQYQPSDHALRKSAVTVDHLARSLGVELMVTSPGEGPVDEVAQALLRIRQISHVASIGRADGYALVFAEDAATLTRALAVEPQVGGILLPPSLIETLKGRWQPSGPALLLSPRPRYDFARAAKVMRPAEPAGGIHSASEIALGATLGLRVRVGPYAVIEKGASIGSGSQIGAGAVINGGVTIGMDCRIYPRVVIYSGVEIGDRVVVHAGAVLGSDGFGYVRDEATGAYIPFPQQGTLVIEDDVEIGANTTIDRGALEETRIGRGTKIDNLVHVGHNVQIGANAILAAQVGISGSSTIGAGAVLAGQVGIGDHAGVGEGVVLGGQGGVLPHKSLEGKGQLFWGTPAKPARQYLRELATLTRLARRGRSDPEQG